MTDDHRDPTAPDPEPADAGGPATPPDRAATPPDRPATPPKPPGAGDSAARSGHRSSAPARGRGPRDKPAPSRGRATARPPARRSGLDEDTVPLAPPPPPPAADTPAGGPESTATAGRQDATATAGRQDATATAGRQDSAATDETVRLTPEETGAGTVDGGADRPTGTDHGAPSRVPREEDADPPDARGPVPAGRRRGYAGVVIVVLLALLGFTLAVQLRGESLDSDLAAMREDDLVRLQSDLSAQEDRLQREIASLEESQRQLRSGAQGREAALEEATRRADELAILAGTAPARGPGLTIRFVAGPEPIAASDILNAVQELRGADAEAMQIAGSDGTTVRVVASTYFVDADGGLLVSGTRLTGPYTITVIGDPPTMRTALNIPDGLVPSIKADGGNVIVDERDTVDVTAVAPPVDLKHAEPVS